MKDFRNLSFGDWLGLFWRRRWYLILAFLLVSAGAGIYAMRLPRLFRSETKIQIVSSPIAQDIVRSAVNSSPVERLNSIQVLLQSRRFLSNLIRQSTIFSVQNPNFSMEDAITSLRSRLKLEPNTDGTFVLSFTATDPKAAFDLVKRAADALIRESTNAGKDLAVETDQFIEEQLRRTHQDLANQEELIKRFKMAHQGELPEQSIANMNALSGLSTQLAAAETTLQRAQDQRRLLDARYREQKRLEAMSGGLLSPQPAPAATAGGQAAAPAPVSARNTQLEAKRAQLAEMNARYYPTHPDVVRLTREIQELEKQQPAAAAERKPDERATAGGAGQSDKPAESKGAPADANLPLFGVSEAEYKIEMQAADNEIVKQQAERDRIREQIKLSQTRLGRAPAIEQEYAALIRERDMLQQQYANLHNKKFNAQMSASLETNNRNDVYRIIDEAILPVRPIFPDRKQFVFLGLIAGFLCGIGAALGREYLDASLGNEREAAVALNLPVLACIPEVTVERMFRRKSIPKRTGAA